MVDTASDLLREIQAGLTICSLSSSVSPRSGGRIEFFQDETCRWEPVRRTTKWIFPRRFCRPSIDARHERYTLPVSLSLSLSFSLCGSCVSLRFIAASQILRDVRECSGYHSG